MKQKITRLTLAGKSGFFGACPASARDCSAMRPARASIPKPVEACLRASRRDTRTADLRTSSPDIDELLQVQDRLRQVLPSAGISLELIRRDTILLAHFD